MEYGNKKLIRTLNFNCRISNTKNEKKVLFFDFLVKQIKSKNYYRI